jgi:hypothetical protein
MVIELCGYEVLIDEEDYEIATKRHWNVHKSSFDRSGHVYFHSFSRKNTVKLDHLLHREVMGCAKGDGKIVDHISGNTLDCRKENLRITNSGGNAKNAKMSKSNTVGLKGVTWYKSTKKYRAQIQCDKKKMSLGYYNTSEEAHNAYAKAANRLFGEYVRT